MREMTVTGSTAIAAMEQHLGELRPRLHRYCARMTGSVIDAEDVVQEACIKAIGALQSGTTVGQIEAWLFRIAHRTALDFLRRRTRRADLEIEADWEALADPVLVVEERQDVTASLRAFMRLPALQRSSVILMDVLGYSLQEIVIITDSTLPAVKSALHRGRGNLRRLAAEPEGEPLPQLNPADQQRLSHYVNRFNARDFDTVRNMLADDVRLDLVNRLELKGRGEVENYFTNYSRMTEWHLTTGFIEQRPAILVTATDAPGQDPLYFILLNWSAGQLGTIRDFYHARYVMADAAWRYLP